MGATKRGLDLSAHITQPPYYSSQELGVPPHGAHVSLNSSVPDRRDPFRTGHTTGIAPLATAPLAPFPNHFSGELQLTSEGPCFSSSGSLTLDFVPEFLPNITFLLSKMTAKNLSSSQPSKNQGPEQGLFSSKNTSLPACLILVPGTSPLSF